MLINIHDVSQWHNWLAATVMLHVSLASIPNQGGRSLLSVKTGGGEKKSPGVFFITLFTQTLLAFSLFLL